jgi:meso-butanediol dehydrogenase / (S,S)-butanediol dehydrogenase / diacetyl reductase
MRPPAVAIVTGGGSGIGAAAARLLDADGYCVVIADRDLQAAEQLAAELDHASLALHVDVAEERDVERLSKAAADFGDPTVLVNAAGIGSTQSAVHTPTAVWDDVLAVNARGTFLCCKHVLPGLLARGFGSIVNVASIAGLVGLRNRVAYCASKGAVIALSRALAVDHVADGVRVNAVAPGTIDSPWVHRLVHETGESLDSLAERQLMGRLGRPEEVAEAILYLATDRSSFATGTVLILDGGLTAT